MRTLLWGFALLLWPWLCCAQDSLVVRNSGARLLVTPEFSRVLQGCNERREFEFASNAVFTLINLCNPNQESYRVTDQGNCLSNGLSLLAVSLKGMEEPILAESMVITDSQFHIRLYGVLEDIHGKRSDFQNVRRMIICAHSGITAAQSLPSGVCREPRQFAVMFDYGAPLSNKILTNGFSFHIRISGKPQLDFQMETFAGEVLESFQRAITIWIGALSDHDHLLTSDVRSFIASRTSRSTGGYILLTPPQVIRLKCPQTATFIIELNFGGDGLFPGFPSPVVLAKGRLEGRTIALNLRDVACYRTIAKLNAENRMTFKDGECTNLLPVLIHELGHAFGISHIETNVGIALMNRNLSEQALVPTTHDVEALVDALQRSIVGAEPGALEFRVSEGVMPPKNWVGSKIR
jgi:hypothetical protein